MFLAVVLALSYLVIYRDLFLGEKTFSHDSLVWFGSFYYYIENIKNGSFPYWDPYSLTGTLFYPNISGYGLLDPTVLLCALVSKIADISVLTLFIYVRLCRIVLFVVGAFYLFRHLSRNSVVSVLSAGVLLFTVTIQNDHQPMMDICFSLPFALFLLLRLLDTIEIRTRYFYLFGFTLVTGVTMNMYIPSFYLFNIVCFSIALFITGRYDLRRVLLAFAEPKMLWCAAACLLLVTMMASPPLVVSLLDTTKEGELFAIAKLVDSDDGNFKEMMATDFGGDLFFDKLRQHMASFITYGSVLNLLYPDTAGIHFRPPGDIAPGGQLYMGVVPIVLIIVGLVYARAHMKFLVLAMVGLVFVTAFSPSGTSAAYTVVQRGINTIFPLLKMIDMRVNFASVLSLYLCLFFCLSVSALIRDDAIPQFVRNRFRPVVLLIFVPMLFKVVVNLLLYEKVFLSGYDTAVMLIPCLMIAGMAVVRYTSIPVKYLLVMFLLVSVVDLWYAGVKAADKIASSKQVNAFLDAKEGYRQYSIEESKRSYKGFEYFRLPYVPAAISPVQAFIETMVHAKSAIISNSLISIFTTKRYYDMFSLLPLEQQLAVEGVVYPVVRFFPVDQVVFGNDPREILSSIRNADLQTLGHRLYLELDASPRQQVRKKIDIKEMKKVSWFGTHELDDVYRNTIPYMKDIRMNMDRFLTTKDHHVQVDHFSINEVVISAENTIGGYLLYNDGWSKYWKAYDHDQELPIAVANYNSKAVFLPPGKHLVRFVFSPTLYKTALVLYYAALVLSCVFIAVSWRSEHGKERSREQ